MNSEPTAYPDRWSLDSWFSGFGKPDYQAFKERLGPDALALLEKAGRAETDTGEMVTLLNELEAFEERLGLLGAYLGCLSADDANNEAVKADEAWISRVEA